MFVSSLCFVFRDAFDRRGMIRYVNFLFFVITLVVLGGRIRFGIGRSIDVGVNYLVGILFFRLGVVGFGVGCFY